MNAVLPRPRRFVGILSDGRAAVTSNPLRDTRAFLFAYEFKTEEAAASFMQEWNERIVQTLVLS